MMNTNVTIYIRVTVSLHITRGRKRISPLVLMINNVPGTLFSLQSCHNYVFTPGDTVFCVITPSNYESSITFLFSQTHKPLKKTPKEFLCVVIMNFHHHCPNCSILRYEIEKKDKRIVDLQLEVQRLQKKIWGKEEFVLRSENELLKNKLKNQ